MLIKLSLALKTKSPSAVRKAKTRLGSGETHPLQGNAHKPIWFRLNKF